MTGFDTVADALRADLLRFYSARGQPLTPADELTIDTNSSLVEGRALPLIDMLERKLGRSVDGMDLLDLGCGFGALSVYFAWRGARVRAVDPHEERLVVGRAVADRHALPVIFEDGLAEHLRYGDGSFDMVVMNNSLCYLVDRNERRTALGHVMRVLRPSGVLLLRNPNRLYPLDQFTRVPLLQLLPPQLAARLGTLMRGHRSLVRLTTIRAARRELESAGFEDVESHGFLRRRGGRVMAPFARYHHQLARRPPSQTSAEAGSATPWWQRAAEPRMSDTTPVAAENAREGATGWWDTRLAAPAHAIEGYPSEPSVRAGEPLELHVSTNPPAHYEIEVVRLGWYAGRGARVVATQAGTSPTSFPVPPLEPRTGRIAAGWPVTDTVETDAEWTTGIYLAKLILRAGPHVGCHAFVPFVVREPRPRADVLVQMPVNTAQAYNPWGGKSLYPSNSTDRIAAVKASFDRPYAAWLDSNPNTRYPMTWDYHLVRFLERESYDVAYTTDVDTHREPHLLLGRRLVMTSGHDEYFSRVMRDAFEHALDSGVSLAFMGSNTAYWQIRYEDDEHTIVEWRHANRDPNPDPAEKTILFRDLAAPRPECRLLGVQFQNGMKAESDPPRDYTVVTAALDDPWFDGTGFDAGASLFDLVGYEWDALQRGCVPRDLTRLFHYEGSPSNADCVRYTAESGATVFATGSLQFAWGLDDWARPGHADERLQQFMRNAMSAMTETRTRSFKRAPAESTR